VEEWDAGEESTEVQDRMGVLAFGQWDAPYPAASDRGVADVLPMRCSCVAPVLLMCC
jgi:hypothetical protein